MCLKWLSRERMMISVKIKENVCSKGFCFFPLKTADS